MKRSCLFVGAKPEATSARRAVRDGGGSSTSASSASLHLVDGAREQRANDVAPARRRHEVREEAGRDAVLEGVPDDGDATQLGAAIRAEAAVVAGRVEVAPAEVLGVADEVAPVGGGGAAAELVEVRAEPLELGAPRARAGSRSAPSGSPEPALLPRPPERVPDDGAGAQRARPQPQARQVDPPEPVHEDRVGGAVRERDRERSAGRGGGRLVLPLERREDPLPAVAGSVATLTGIASRVTAPSSAVRKKLIAATPTTSSSSTARDTIPSPAGFRSNHQANSSSESCVVPTRASRATSAARRSAV